MQLGTTWGPVLEKALTMEPYDGMRFMMGGFFDSLAARPQAAALFVQEALVDQPLAVPENADLDFGAIKGLYERGQAEGIFAPHIPFELAYITAVTTLISAVIFHPRAASILMGDAPFDPAEHRELLLDQVFKGMSR